LASLSEQGLENSAKIYRDVFIPVFICEIMDVVSSPGTSIGYEGAGITMRRTLFIMNLFVMYNRPVE
jgi:hypothetical protein